MWCWCATGRRLGASSVGTPAPPISPKRRKEKNRPERWPRCWGHCHFSGCWPAHFNEPSALQRAQRTCALAGFGERMEMDADVVEWNYGVYEGLTRAEIQSRTPGWMVFRHGCPQGESAEEVGARADRVIARLTGGEGPTLLDTATLNVLSSTKTHRPWPVGMWPSPETPPRERWTARTGSGSFTRRSPSR